LAAWARRGTKHINTFTVSSLYLTYTEGSALLEDGVHEIDTLNWMINDRVVRVTASGGNNVFKDRETADHVSAIIEYASGLKFSFELCNTCCSTR
jgi:predicted dehydrogenase